MPRNDTLSSYKTTVATGDDGITRVTYHSTCIVAWNRDYVWLNTGGWDTVTTRRKMNQAARQYGLGFRVYRDKGTTYVEHCGRGKRWPLAELDGSVPMARKA